MKKVFFILFILIYLTFLKSIDFTKAVFSDVGTSSGFFSATYWYPIISNVSSLLATVGDPNEAKAIINWTTNENATSNLEYSTTAGGPYTLVTPQDSTVDNTSHSREIIPVDPETTYYYRVKSKNISGYETISSQYSFTTNGVRLATPSSSEIVINEFLPNPTGDDNAPLPNGEWVELYNRGGEPVDLTGWFLTDSNPAHILNITSSNTVSSDSSTTGLLIAPGEFIVVYRNGDGDFSLNNDADGDQVNLYNSASLLIDSHTYNSGSGDTVLENKSFARFPDGSDTWFDPIPTAGKPNISVLALPTYAVTETDGDLQVTYDKPLFPSTIIWYPGLSIKKSFMVKNLGGSPHKTFIKADNKSQTGDLANNLYFKIIEGVTNHYGGNNDKTIKNFWEEGVVNLSDIGAGSFTNYDVTITMPVTAGNEYQGKTAKFDLIIGFVGTESKVSVTTITKGQIKGAKTSRLPKPLILGLIFSSGSALFLIYYFTRKP